MKLRETLYFFLLAFFLQACNDTITDPNYHSGTSYYPIEEGWYIHYQVDNKDLTNEENSTTYQLREIIGKPYDDGFGGENYPLYRYKRDNEDVEWELDSVWSVVYRNNHLIRYENAIPLLKLTNPLIEGSRFNQNTYNGLDAITPSGQDLRYEVETVGRDFTFEDQVYMNTAVVLEVNNSSLITNSEETRRAVYQKDIGLILVDHNSISKVYYEFNTTQPSLAGNPYCGVNSNRQVIDLDNGDRVDNPFFELDNCETNPIFGVDDDSVNRWITKWESSANSPIVEARDGDNGTKILLLINPNEFNGYREQGSAMTQKIIGYGIDKTVD
ncbi:hypothetical protein [Flammeovirga sp. SJP92]|uniref:hypothetical protein n=1 Tax=Flammeovirga sp. SJP92 TaxID=1775430 RepID=UPI000789304E|nr:hypothetical protein [Flammeovirga sp. SJP92]KXX72294.1 hypothetical protein AVL50_01445 [Flammeovirga sp. SJP92]